jgi:type II secretory pathway pseudopilin PulG
MECGVHHARTLAGVIAALHPRLWGVHALGLLAVTAAVALGIWQWNVGDGRKASQSNEYAHAAPQALASVISPGASFPASQLGRPVRVTGTWVPNSQVSISGSDWVAMAVRSGDAAAYVVIGSGSVPASLPSGPADLVGWIQPDQSSVTPAHGRVLPVMSNGLAAPYVPVTLLDAYVVAQKPAAGLAAVPEPTLPKANFWTGLRNWLYAFEWWFFGVFAGFIWWRQIRELTAPPVPSET